ncbi:MAG: hypothetical protein ACRC4L_01790 [Mycoplasma sp.]
MILDFDIVSNIANKDGYTVFEKDGNKYKLLLSFSNKEDCDYLLSKFKNTDNLIIIENTKIIDAFSIDEILGDNAEVIITDSAKPDNGMIEWGYKHTSFVITSYPESFDEDKACLAMLVGFDANDDEFLNDLKIWNGEEYIID